MAQWDIHDHFPLAGFAPDRKVFNLGFRQRQEQRLRATFRATELFSTCQYFTTLRFIFQHFHLAFFKNSRLLYTTPRMNFGYSVGRFRKHRHDVAEASIGILALRFIGNEGAGRGRQPLILRDDFIIGLRPFQIAAGAPGPVAHMPATFLQWLLGQVLGPALSAIRSEPFKIKIVTVTLPNIPNDFEILARGIDNKMMVEPAIRMVTFSDPYIEQLDLQRFSMGPQQPDEVVHPFVRGFPGPREITVTVCKGNDQIAALEIGGKDQHQLLPAKLGVERFPRRCGDPLPGLPPGRLVLGVDGGVLHRHP